MKREVVSNGKLFEVDVIGEREIFINGKEYKGEMLSIEDDNTISKVIDAFEDGMNRLEGEYEVYEYGKFKIQRKVSLLSEG